MTTDTVHNQSLKHRLLSLFQRPYFIYLIVLFAAGIGYWLAPTDFAKGDYLVEVQVRLDGQVFIAEYPFVVGDDDGQITSYAKTFTDYQIVIEGNEQYTQGLGQQINYSVRVLTADGSLVSVASEDITSVISGRDYQLTLPSIQSDEGLMKFQMHMPYKANIIMGLLFGVAVLWLTEPLPLGASALLIPVVAVIAGAATTQVVLQPFFHPIIVLFLAGFLMAQALRHTGTDRLIALAILRRASLKPIWLMLTVMSVTAFLSMWMSNTASIAMMIPIVLAILESIPKENERDNFHKALILGTAYAATIGGIGSAIGTPANILALTFINDFTDYQTDFSDWFAYGLPMVIIMIPIIWGYLILTFRVQVKTLTKAGGELDIDKDFRSLGKVKSEQKAVMFVFLMVMGLWLTEQFHHMPVAIVGLGGALVLFVLQLLKEEDFNQINWNALLTFGGGLSMGTILVLSGVSDWLALHLVGLTSFPAILVILIVAAVTIVIGAFISNTAAAAMLIPIAIPLAHILHIDPRLLVVIIAIASSIDFAMVIGTPPTMMAYSTGYFKSSDIFRRGLILDIVGILILSLVVIWVWQLLGVVQL